jgi:biopolymer transport protein ExbD
MAGSSSRSTGGKKKARIEIIPLIDVIFFLLATFVLFTLSLNKSAGIPVDQPGAETGVPRDPNGTVTVSITAEGTVGWDKDQVTLDEFINRLRAYKTANPDGRVLINGDENATFNSVFGYVIDEIRKAGFQKVYIETRTKQSNQ